MENKTLQIVEVEDVIANRYPNLNLIEINKHLKDYPNLYKVVMKHELDHKDSNPWWKDLWLDLTCFNFKYFFEWYRFMWKHPRPFLKQLSPFRKKEGMVYCDYNLIAIYSAMLIGIVVICFEVNYLINMWR